MSFPYDYGLLSLLNFAIAILLYAPLVHYTLTNYYFKRVQKLKEGIFHKQMFWLSLTTCALILIVLALEAAYFWNLQSNQAIIEAEISVYRSYQIFFAAFLSVNSYLHLLFAGQYWALANTIVEIEEEDTQERTKQKINWIHWSTSAFIVIGAVIYIVGQWDRYSYEHDGLNWFYVIVITPEVMNIVWVALAFRKLSKVKSENFFLQSKQVAWQQICFVLLTVSNIVAYLFMNESRTAGWFFTLILLCVLFEWIGQCQLVYTLTKLADQQLQIQNRPVRPSQLNSKMMVQSQDDSSEDEELSYQDQQYGLVGRNQQQFYSMAADQVQKALLMSLEAKD